MSEGRAMHYDARGVEVSFDGARVGGLADIRIGVDHAPAGARSYTAVTTVTATVPLTIVGPIVVVDCERRTATIDGRELRWTARTTGPGCTALTVTDPRFGVLGIVYIHALRSFSVDVDWRHARGRRRKRAHRLLYPLGRAWSGLPQRAPRGRKARGA